MIRILSWNVNGFKSIARKGFDDVVTGYDIIMIQEARTNEVPLMLEYNVYLFPAEKKGYSGVMTFSRFPPKRVIKGIGEEFDREGRVLTLEFEKFFAVNAYFPRAGDNLSRLKYKMEFNYAIEKFLINLRREKEVIICGDFNAILEDWDAAYINPTLPGQTPEERSWLRHILEQGFIDTFRVFHRERDRYTWWSYVTKARERNEGWRIDYCLVSEGLRDDLKYANILEKVTGSDHAPIYLELDL
ncbi:exodeoxyribonuclease III [Sulfolobales archaeon HS-7]|nr:exodeoxyribonuclease III [Sulfolobales archaeon HS-7]